MMYIRKAEKKDVYDCVPLIYSAGVPLFDYIYRHEQITAEHFIHKEFLSEYGYTSYNLHWVVEHQGKVIAVVACYATKDLSRMDNGTIKNILKMYKFRFPRVFMRALNSSSVVTKPSETSLHVANFGVHPNYRSKGIGTQLLQHLKMHAIEQGYSGLSLDVSKANPKGQSLYERIGFKVVEETAFKDENTQRMPNGRRMEWYF